MNYMCADPASEREGAQGGTDMLPLLTVVVSFAAAADRAINI
jgi:hypothetical protein